MGSPDPRGRMARIADAYWRFEKLFGGPPARRHRFVARHPRLIGTCIGAVTFASWLLASLNAGDGVTRSILISLLVGLPVGASFIGICLLERKRQQKLFGDP